MKSDVTNYEILSGKLYGVIELRNKKAGNFMLDKFTKELTSKLTIKRILFVNSLTIIVSVVTLYLLAINSYKISDKQIIIEGKNLLALIFCNYFLLIFISILTSAVLLRFRKGSEYLLKTIKAVAAGEFNAIEDRTEEDNENDSAYQALHQVVEELKGSKEEMEQFTNEYLHEIKTPLSAIRGFAEILIETGEGIESPERMKYLRIIEEESNRLTELSQNTLLLAKMDACQIVTDKEEYDLGEQIKKCVILFLAQIEEKEIELDMDVEDLVYYGNREFMEQMWINLLGNAIKFTPTGGSIEITGNIEEDGIVLTFADSGPGMDEETKQHIFEKFYQGAEGRQKGGNGIGLSIVKRIITLCNGEIEVISAVGKGTIFKIFLPNIR